MNLPELEVDLRERFQTYRRRIDMVTRFKALNVTDAKIIKAFIKAMNDEDEAEARRQIKIVEVSRGGK